VISSFRVRKTAAALCLTATTALTTACSTEWSSKAPTPGANPAQSVSTGTPSTQASDAETILNEAFMGSEPLGSGFGQLQEHVGNTLARTPDKVLSVTFAFTCTGTATATLKIRVDGKETPSAAGTHTCDGSVFQRSVELPKPSAVGFQASITGPYNGSFAYAYHVEKKAA
jgi:hypothetical protein